MLQNGHMGSFLKKHPYLCFSLFFVLCAALVFGNFAAESKSLIRNADAIQQHYPALVYYGSWLRQLLSNLFVRHVWEIPTWELSIGYGSDLITTLHYYGLGDPLTLLSVFVSPEKTEYLYDFLVIFRLYLAGLSCTAFFRCRGLSGAGPLLGALVYCFSGYGINPGIFHPFFALPMILLPLLLLSVEQLYRYKSPKWLIFSVFLSAVSNVYFFYMLCAFTILYTIIRYFSYFPSFHIKECVRWILRFLAGALTGCALAAPILVPNLLSIATSDRMAVSRELLTLYPRSYYTQLPAALITSYNSYYCYVSVAAVAMVLVFVAFSAPLKRYLAEKCVFLGLLVFAMIPRIGSVLNGFSYATNRWIWALLLCIAWICARVIPDLPGLSRRQLLLTSAFCLLYTAACLLPRSCREAKTVTALGFLWLTVLLLVLFRRRILGAGGLYCCLLLVTVGSLWANASFLYSPRWENGTASYLDAGTAYDHTHGSAFTLVEAQPESASSRFESSGLSQLYNGAMLNRINGVSYYFSAISPGTSEFQRTQWLNAPLGQQFSSLEGRTLLDLAMGVRYYAIPAGQTQLLPYSYDILAAEGDGIQIYTSASALPLVYVYDTVYTPDEAWSVLQSQQGLLQSAAVEEEQPLPTAVPECDSTILPYRVNENETDGVRLGDGVLTVTQDNAQLQLEFEEVTDAELYLIFDGISYQREDVTNTTISIGISSGQVKRTLNVVTPLDNFYCGYEDFLINLGYTEGGRSSIRITFPHKGTYTFDALTVAAQPMSTVEAAADKLQNSGVSALEISGSSIRFETHREAAGMACAAIPYSTGWSATVDGEPTAVQKINNGLCGILVPAGDHTVSLSYRTPYLSISCLISSAALLWLLGCAARQRLHRRKPRSGTPE